MVFYTDKSKALPTYCLIKIATHLLGDPEILPLTLYILMDFPIHIDTVTMACTLVQLSIVHFEESQAESSKI